MLLYKKLQLLDDKTREVMYLRLSGELSFKEIGIILNKTENWARVTFYRGKNKLKEVD
jgi:RNA polymerase sigma-70 factor (ECF subfamily)